MTDKVKSALEWWRDLRYPQDTVSDVRHAVICAAYAAEHPPDEDDPITPEWLVANYDAEDNDGELEFMHGQGVEVAMISKGDYWIAWFDESDWPIPLTTRGQLLRLLKELEQ